MIVSVVVPATVWDERLARTLESVRGQRLPADTELEVLVASPVGPRAAWRPVCDERWVENPAGAIPAGLNRAVAAGHGEVVVRVDSRCSLPPDYVARVLGVLEDPSVGMVGGAALVMDRGAWGDLYGTVFNSPLLGPSRYRYSRRSGPASTAYLGAWRRGDLEGWGGFDERLLRNQDNEIASRISSLGLTVWYDAEAVVGYEAAKGPLAAIRHHYGFGRWRMRQAAMGQSSMSASQRAVVVSAVFAVGLGAAALTRRRTRGLTLALGGMTYAVAALAARNAAARLRDRRSDLALPRPSLVATVAAPTVAAVLDGAWALGLTLGRLRPDPNVAVSRPSDGPQVPRSEPV